MTPLKIIHCNLAEYEYFDSLSCSTTGTLYIPLEEGRACAINLNENLEKFQYVRIKDIYKRVKKLISSRLGDFLYVIDSASVLEIKCVVDPAK